MAWHEHSGNEWLGQAQAGTGSSTSPTVASQAAATSSLHANAVGTVPQQQQLYSNLNKMYLDHMQQIDRTRKFLIPTSSDNMPNSIKFTHSNLVKSGLKNEFANCSQIATLVAFNRCNLGRLLVDKLDMVFSDGSPDFPAILLSEIIR